MPSEPVRAAVPGDVDSWLELAREVEDLFGPMPDLDAYIGRSVERGTALVAADGSRVIGGVLLSRDGQPHCIRWLAVRGSHRQRGVGSALVRAVLDRWRTGDIEVVTFTEDTQGGQSARRLYENFGFTCMGRTNRAPDGGVRDLFLLSRPSRRVDLNNAGSS